MSLKLALCLLSFSAIQLSIGCSDGSSRLSENESAAIEEAISEVMCRDKHRSYAFSEVVELVEANPESGISVKVFDTASDIEKSGCGQIIAKNGDKWEKSNIGIQRRKERFEKMKAEGKFEEILNKAKGMQK